MIFPRSTTGNKHAATQKMILRQLFDSPLCTFVADAGFVCPLEARCDDDMLVIMPYQHHTKEIQDDTLRYLNEHWQSDTRISLSESITYDDESIKKTWWGSDVLYVAKTFDGAFAGCVAVDRKNMNPFLSHLFVPPHFRGNGYAKRLLRIVEHHAQLMRFQEIQLWCYEDIVSFYEKQGWEHNGTHGESYVIMKKRLETTIINKSITDDVECLPGASCNDLPKGASFW